MLTDIPFTQYLRPFGRPVKQYAPMPDGYDEKVQTILDSGSVFEAEVLTTGEVAMTVTNHDQERDIAIEICPNSPEVVDALKRLIDAGYERTRK